MAGYPGKRPEPLVAEEPSITGTYTAEDYLKWTFEGLVELIRGKIYKMSPAPSLKHQRLEGLLHIQLADFFSNHSCVLWMAPTDVYLIHEGEDYRNTRNVVQPDLLVVCDKTKLHSFGCVGAPDLIIEILSPSNSRKDIRLKHELYEEYGVKEYWMVQISDRMFIVNVLENGKYVTQRPYTVGDVISPRQFPDLKVDLEELFRGIEDVP